MSSTTPRPATGTSPRIDGADNSKEFLAISNDANPLDGFSNVYDVPVAASGDLNDFAKFGYNADAIVIEGNDFGDGHAVVTAVDKAQAIAGTLVYYQSHRRAFNFRALTPAQMHDAVPGGPMWFMASTGDPTYDGTTPNTIRVTEMTNILSNSPTYTDFAVSVNTYGPNSGFADQPGAPGSVATNDVTTTIGRFPRRQDGDGLLPPALPADGFKTHQGPLVRGRRLQRHADSGAGRPDRSGPGRGDLLPGGRHRPVGQHRHLLHGVVLDRVRLGVRGRPHRRHAAGHDHRRARSSGPAAARCPTASARATTAAPSTIRAPACSGAPTSTSAPMAAPTSGGPRSPRSRSPRRIGTDFYSVNANAGDNLHFATSTPAGGPNEFVNNFYPELLLYDPNGNLVAVAAGNASDGRNSVIDFTVPDGDAGKWTIEVTPSPNTPLPTQGEYGLLVTGATGALAPFVVTSTIPAAGALVQPPSTITVTFNEPVNPTSLTPGELEVNGVAATAVTLVDAHTVDWTVDPGLLRAPASTCPTW